MNPAQHVVSAGVLVRDGRVLLCHRRDDLDFYPGVWDLVGGHRERGEEPLETLVREAREELGIEIVGARELPLATDNPALNLHGFVVSAWSGEPTNVATDEHTEIRWFAPDELDGLELADPRYARILAALVPAA